MVEGSKTEVKIQGIRHIWRINWPHIQGGEYFQNYSRGNRVPVCNNDPCSFLYLSIFDFCKKVRPKCKQIKLYERSLI
jgi:hypothetical protein